MSNFKHEKPDFVKNYNKPKNTEIKHINGHWYLYERTSAMRRRLKKYFMKNIDVL